MVIELATVYAFSSLLLMMIIIAFYFAIFFMIFYIAFWALSIPLRVIAKIITV